jgi:hypothetical protein
VVLSETFTAGIAIGFGLVTLGSALATRPVRAGTADPRERRSEKSGCPVPGRMSQPSSQSGR